MKVEAHGAYQEILKNIPSPHVEGEGVLDGFLDSVSFWEIDVTQAPKISKRIGRIKAIASYICLLYTSPSPRDATLSRMPSSA